MSSEEANKEDAKVQDAKIIAKNAMEAAKRSNPTTNVVEPQSEVREDAIREEAINEVQNTDNLTQEQVGKENLYGKANALLRHNMEFWDRRLDGLVSIPVTRNNLLSLNMDRVAGNAKMDLHVVFSLNLV
ncbi:unnamed protein product [Cylicostephanus goldi]|uniref:Uncharacterized protein n=1 Tax=Cylicostephanus goldi TaxID=71465 RepID=A0A3P6QEJ5_CYLGO|nr:unnamed protein product [Cylicostephanus goldi]